MQCTAGNQTTVNKTRDPNDIQAWLSNINVTGGADCPEFSLTGIQAGTSLFWPQTRFLLFHPTKLLCVCVFLCVCMCEFVSMF